MWPRDTRADTRAGRVRERWTRSRVSEAKKAFVWLRGGGACRCTARRGRCASSLVLLHNDVVEARAEQQQRKKGKRKAKKPTGEQRERRRCRRGRVVVVGGEWCTRRSGTVGDVNVAPVTSRDERNADAVVSSVRGYPSAPPPPRAPRRRRSPQATPHPCRAAAIGTLLVDSADQRKAARYPAASRWRRRRFR